MELFTVLHLAPFYVSLSAFLTARLCVIQMKLPSSVGQKKIKAIEQILLEQGVGKCKYFSAVHLYFEVSSLDSLQNEYLVVEETTFCIFEK